jgi:cellulose biosynthesis protein BcsQ
VRGDKDLLCGKGGSGKSTIAILMARALDQEKKVYIVD